MADNSLLTDPPEYGDTDNELLLKIAQLLTSPAALSGVILASLPTADPHVNGQLWNNGGVMSISNG